MQVRVIDYRLEGIADAEPIYRLVTTIFDPGIASAEELAALYHERWEIENRLHWVLDVDMNEDRARNRCDNGPRNLAVLKHMALNVLNAELSKLPIRRKMKKADRSNAFLRTLLVAI